jgi:hypothetical protein
MKNKRIEEILVRAALGNLLITKDEIKGIYIYGSRLFETDNDNSDLDYCIVVEDNEDYKEYWQVETPDLDLHIMQISEYQKLLNECNDMALSMYFQRDPIMKCEVEYNLDLPTLRKSFSSKANNSFVKFKKKLIIEEDYDVRAAIKSLFHSIRILDFGTHIARPGSGASNQDCHGENIEWIEQVFEETNNNWEEIHKVFKPIYNEYATEFKKVAPKV